MPPALTASLTSLLLSNSSHLAELLYAQNPPPLSCEFSSVLVYKAKKACQPLCLSTQKSHSFYGRWGEKLALVLSRVVAKYCFKSAVSPTGLPFFLSP
jgi:hypothetical protein